MIKVTLPVYYELVYKTKPNKTLLVGLNMYRNAHFHLQNKVKQHYAAIVTNQVTGSTPIVGRFRVSYTYYYKSSVSDLGNVCSLSSKVLLDALQELNLIQQDNVQYCIEEVYRVGGLDKLNPRVEILLTNA